LSDTLRTIAHRFRLWFVPWSSPSCFRSARAILPVQPAADRHDLFGDFGNAWADSVLSFAIDRRQRGNTMGSSGFCILGQVDDPSRRPPRDGIEIGRTRPRMSRPSAVCGHMTAREHFVISITGLADSAFTGSASFQSVSRSGLSTGTTFHDPRVRPGRWVAGPRPAARPPHRLLRRWRTCRCCSRAEGGCRSPVSPARTTSRTRSARGPRHSARQRIRTLMDRGR